MKVLICKCASEKNFHLLGERPPGTPLGLPLAFVYFVRQTLLYFLAKLVIAVLGNYN